MNWKMIHHENIDLMKLGYNIVRPQTSGEGHREDKDKTFMAKWT